MKIGLIVYGSLDAITGGNVYDRLLVARLRDCGDQVEIFSLRQRGYAGRLADNLTWGLDGAVDILLEDELAHLSLLRANALPRRYPIVSIVHNLHSAERRPAWQNALHQAIEKRYLDSVDGLVFNSRATLESVRIGLQVNKPFVVAAPGGDRLGSWTAEAVRARAIESGALRLLFLANLTPVKGMHVLLDALALLKPDRFELDAVGSCKADPRYATAMQRRAAGLGMHIVFHGTLDGMPLIKRLQRAQLMVIPSYYEGFGIAYLEGMAFGLPAIGTQAGAIPEMISAGANGFMIAPGDSRMLARLLNNLDADREGLARMAVSALEHFKTRHTWKQSAALIRDFLIKMSGGKPSENS